MKYFTVYMLAVYPELICYIVNPPVILGLLILASIFLLNLVLKIDWTLLENFGGNISLGSEQVFKKAKLNKENRARITSKINI